MSALKCTVQKITGIAPTQQALIFRFKELAPALPLGSYNIPVCLVPHTTIGFSILTCCQVKFGAVSIRLNGAWMPRTSQDNSVLELKRIAGGGGRSNILLRTFAK